MRGRVELGTCQLGPHVLLSVFGFLFFLCFLGGLVGWLVGAFAHRMLIGACNSMACPIPRLQQDRYGWLLWVVAMGGC